LVGKTADSHNCAVLVELIISAEIHTRKASILGQFDRYAVGFDVSLVLAEVETVIMLTIMRQCIFDRSMHADVAEAIFASISLQSH